MHHTFRTWLKGGEWNFETSSSSPRREDRRGGEREILGPDSSQPASLHGGGVVVGGKGGGSLSRGSAECKTGLFHRFSLLLPCCAAQRKRGIRASPAAKRERKERVFLFPPSKLFSRGKNVTPYYNEAEQRHKKVSYSSPSTYVEETFSRRAKTNTLWKLKSKPNQEVIDRSRQKYRRWPPPPQPGAQPISRSLFFPFP